MEPNKRFVAMRCWHGHWYVHDRKTGKPAEGWEYCTSATEAEARSDARERNEIEDYCGPSEWNPPRDYPYAY